MPYIECPDCGQRALHAATRCPHCGFGFPARPLHGPLTASRPKWLHRPLVWLGLTAVWLAVVFAIGHWRWSRAASVPLPTDSETGQVGPGAMPRSAAVALEPETAMDTVNAAQPSPPPAAVTAPAPQASERLRRYARTWTHVRGARRGGAESVRVLDPGEAVLVDSLRRGWYRVLSDGQAAGYVHGSNLDAAPPSDRP